jgi:hypothetical protein
MIALASIALGSLSSTLKIGSWAGTNGLAIGSSGSIRARTNWCL